MSVPSSLPSETTSLERGEGESQLHRLESRNILCLAAYQIMLRLAWVFKTESVMMPAFLYAISGQTWMQGFLPMLNRFGQSLPPLAYAETLRRMPRKKLSMLGTTGLMGTLFLVIALGIILAPARRFWWPTFFLTLYGLFFVAVGLNSLAYNTLQGKLIRPARRGRVTSRGGMLGSAAAVVGAWLLLTNWRSDSIGAFLLPFLVTGGGMLLAAALAGVIAEWPDVPEDSEASGGERPSLRDQLAGSFALVRDDRHFRRLALCAMTFVSSQFLVPHYVPLALERLPSETVNLALLLIVQNIGVGLFSLAMGWLADRCGNRLVLRLALAGSALTPVVAIALANAWIPGGRHFFWLAYLGLGLQPVTFRTLTNYSLELTDPQWHPRYLSTLKICVAVPFVISIPIGWLVGFLGYEIVFLAGAVVIAVSCVLTWSMEEPRHWMGMPVGDAPVEET